MVNGKDMNGAECSLRPTTNIRMVSSSDFLARMSRLRKT